MTEGGAEAMEEEDVVLIGIGAVVAEPTATTPTSQLSGMNSRPHNRHSVLSIPMPRLRLSIHKRLYIRLSSPFSSLPINISSRLAVRRRDLLTLLLTHRHLFRLCPRRSSISIFNSRILMHNNLAHTPHPVSMAGHRQPNRKCLCLPLGPM